MKFCYSKRQTILSETKKNVLDINYLFDSLLPQEKCPIDAYASRVQSTVCPIVSRAFSLANTTSVSISIYVRNMFLRHFIERLVQNCFGRLAGNSTSFNFLFDVRFRTQNNRLGHDFERDVRKSFSKIG